MKLATPRLTSYIPHKPSEKQAAFLLLNCREALYGGAAGGGKSDALLMGALQYADMPGYAALILRRTYADLSLPGALMDRAQQWLAGTDASWNGQDHRWTFPSGATLTFGYLEHENDMYRYQGPEFQYIAFDELTQFKEKQYRYLFSRLRRLAGSTIPLRMRTASNPGGVGHVWVKQRFMVEGRKAGRIFIPAKLDDNPHIDRVEYIASLKELDPVTLKRYLEGDWDATDGGDMFRREWFEIISTASAELRKVRYWDLAGTAPNASNPDPDWTAGLLLGRNNDGLYTVLDVKHVRSSPLGVEKLVRQTAEIDGKGVPIHIEQEPGASGKAIIEHYRRTVLDGWRVDGSRPTGDKRTRAVPVSGRAQAEDIKLLKGAWVGDFLDELELFPNGGHDDQVDALSGAYEVLSAPMGVFVG